MSLPRYILILKVEVPLSIVVWISLVILQLFFLFCFLCGVRYCGVAKKDTTDIENNESELDPIVGSSNAENSQPPSRGFQHSANTFQGQNALTPAYEAPNAATPRKRNLSPNTSSYTSSFIGGAHSPMFEEMDEFDDHAEEPPPTVRFGGRMSHFGSIISLKIHTRKRTTCDHWKLQFKIWRTAFFYINDVASDIGSLFEYYYNFPTLWEFGFSLTFIVIYRVFSSLFFYKQRMKSLSFWQLFDLEIYRQIYHSSDDGRYTKALAYIKRNEAICEAFPQAVLSGFCVLKYSDVGLIVYISLFSSIASISFALIKLDESAFTNRKQYTPLWFGRFFLRFFEITSRLFSLAFVIRILGVYALIPLSLETIVFVLLHLWDKNIHSWPNVSCCGNPFECLCEYTKEPVYQMDPHGTANINIRFLCFKCTYQHEPLGVATLFRTSIDVMMYAIAVPYFQKDGYFIYLYVLRNVFTVLYLTITITLELTKTLNGTRVVSDVHMWFVLISSIVCLVIQLFIIHIIKPLIISEGTGDTICKAAKDGDIDSVRDQIEIGGMRAVMKEDHEKRNAIHYAAKSNLPQSKEILQRLCKKMTENGQEVDKADRFGYTPLCLSVKEGHVENVKVLLQYEANPDAWAGNEPASFGDITHYSTDKFLIHEAAECGYAPIISFLNKNLKALDEKAEPVTDETRRGWTPLMFTCWKSGPTPSPYPLDTNHKLQIKHRKGPVGPSMTSDGPTVCEESQSIHCCSKRGRREARAVLEEGKVDHRLKLAVVAKFSFSDETPEEDLDQLQNMILKCKCYQEVGLEQTVEDNVGYEIDYDYLKSIIKNDVCVIFALPDLYFPTDAEKENTRNNRMHSFKFKDLRSGFETHPVYLQTNTLGKEVTLRIQEFNLHITVEVQDRYALAAQKLLDLGSDVNHHSTLPYCSPLSLALGARNPHVVAALLRCGAKPCKRDFLASGLSYVEFLKLAKKRVQIGETCLLKSLFESDEKSRWPKMAWFRYDRDLQVPGRTEDALSHLDNNGGRCLELVVHNRPQFDAMNTSRDSLHRNGTLLDGDEFLRSQQLLPTVEPKLRSKDSLNAQSYSTSKGPGVPSASQSLHRSDRSTSAETQLPPDSPELNDQKSSSRLRMPGPLRKHTNHQQTRRRTGSEDKRDKARKYSYKPGFDYEDNEGPGMPSASQSMHRSDRNTSAETQLPPESPELNEQKSRSRRRQPDRPSNYGMREPNHQQPHRQTHQRTPSQIARIYSYRPGCDVNNEDDENRPAGAGSREASAPAGPAERPAGKGRRDRYRQAHPLQQFASEPRSEPPAAGARRATAPTVRPAEGRGEQAETVEPCRETTQDPVSVMKNSDHAI